MVRRVEGQIDDVLGSISLVHRSHHLEDELFGALVDLLVEHILLELAVDVGDGTMTPDEYESRIRELATQCRAVGLLLH